MLTDHVFRGSWWCVLYRQYEDERNTYHTLSHGASLRSTGSDGLRTSIVSPIERAGNIGLCKLGRCFAAGPENGNRESLIRMQAIIAMLGTRLIRYSASHSHDTDGRHDRRRSARRVRAGVGICRVCLVTTTVGVVTVTAAPSVTGPSVKTVVVLVDPEPTALQCCTKGLSRPLEPICNQLGPICLPCDKMYAIYGGYRHVWDLDPFSHRNQL